MKEFIKRKIVPIYSIFFIIIELIVIYSLLQIITPTNNYIKKYILEHKSEIIQSNDLFGGNGTTIVLKTDHHYFDDITINSTYNNVIFWADRDKVNNKLFYKYLWLFKSDKSFYLNPEHKLDKEIIDILTPKTKI